VDPVELLQAIEDGTKGEVAVSDFYPTSFGMMLEPFLSLLGMGDYNIRPSPFCGFGTILVNSDQLNSVPVSRLFDMPKLFDAMIPILKDLQQQPQIKLSATTLLKSLALAASLKKAIEACMSKKSGSNVFGVVDLWSYLINNDPNNEKSKWQREILHNAQIFIVHNQMDVGVVDGVRRSRCSMCLQHPTRASVTGACTNCI